MIGMSSPSPPRRSSVLKFDVRSFDDCQQSLSKGEGAKRRPQVVLDVSAISSCLLIYEACVDRIIHSCRLFFLQLTPPPAALPTQAPLPSKTRNFSSVPLKVCLGRASPAVDEKGRESGGGDDFVIEPSKSWGIPTDPCPQNLDRPPTQEGVVRAYEKVSQDCKKRGSTHTIRT